MWPFGPPHLTLKPSKKQKKQKQLHPTTKQNKANKQKQNQHQKEKQKQETQKHPNLLVVLFCFESSCLIFFFASCFLVVVVFCFCCFGILYFLFLATYQKHLSNFGNCKKPKNENAEKMHTGTRAVSTGVLTNSVFFFFLFCVSLNFALFAEKTIKRGFSQNKKKNTQINKTPSVKNWSKLALKTGPSMLRNKLDQFSTLELGHCFVYFSSCFLKVLFFLQGERDFQNNKNLDQFSH